VFVRAATVGYRLIHVDLSFNQLKRLPEELSNLEELETLLLSQNQLVELPDSIVLLCKYVINAS
jgi:Leucine-rich repeat (LRR) protein